MNPIMMIPHRVGSKHLYTGNPPQQQQQNDPKNQYYRQHAATAATVSTTPIWALTVKNFLQAGHEDFDDTEEDDALCWCE